MKIIFNRRTIWPIIVLVLGLLLEGYYLWASKTQPPAPAAKPAMVSATTSLPAVLGAAETGQSATAAPLIETSATAEAAQAVPVSPKIGGHLLQLYVEEGQIVKKGQLIAQLEQDPTLLTALGNARANLSTTMAAANKNIAVAEAAVSAAQTNLDNTKINAAKSVEQAKIAVRSAEIALAQAQDAQANTSDSNQQAVADAYEQSKVVMHNNLASILSALTTVGDIIGQQPGNPEANNAYEDILGAGDFQSLITAKNLFAQAYSNYLSAQKKYDGLSLLSSFNQIDQAIKDVKTALALTRQTLTQTRETLNSTPTKKGFSATALSGLKTAVDGQLTAINQSENALLASKQAIARAKLGTTAATDNTQAALKQAENSLSLAKQKLSLAQAQEKAQVAAAQKQLESAQANLASVRQRAQQQITAARAQVSTVLAQLENTKVKAPLAGLVSKTYFQAGEMLSPGRPLAEIINDQAIKFEIGLNAKEVNKIKIGQKADIVIEGLKNKFSGRVYYVAEAADPVSGKFKAKILVANEDKAIKPGMVAKITIK